MEILLTSTLQCTILHPVGSLNDSIEPSTGSPVHHSTPHASPQTFHPLSCSIIEKNEDSSSCLLVLPVMLEMYARELLMSNHTWSAIAMPREVDALTSSRGTECRCGDHFTGRRVPQVQWSSGDRETSHPTHRVRLWQELHTSGSSKEFSWCWSRLRFHSCWLREWTEKPETISKNTQIPQFLQENLRGENQT